MLSTGHKVDDSMFSRHGVEQLPWRRDLIRPYLIPLYDATPAYTVFTSAACGTVGTGLSGCNLVQAPSVGAAGALRWGFAGSLTPGGSGTVTFSVTIQ